MIRKSILTAFTMLFIAAIALPPLNMNLKSGQRSAIDNRMLNELPRPRDLKHGFRSKLERALNDRIGFRNKMILSYQEINDALFGLMMHPTYMYGKNGYVYFRGRGYVNGYQNIYSKEHVEEAAQYIKRIEDYLSSRGIGFFYFLIPDKKTVYPEYFPDGINKSSNLPIMEVLLNRVGELGVDCVTPLDTFLAQKNDVQLYNVQYDAGHWNDDGAITGISLLLDKISEKYAKVTPLDRNKYERSMRKVTTLLVSEYKIDEEIPTYRLKKQYDHTTLDEDLRKEVVSEKGHVCNVYDNAAKADGLTALIFHDSYFVPSAYHRFFSESFARTIFVHSDNLHRLTYYLNIFLPDIVVLENVERVTEVGSMLFGKKNMDAAFFPHLSASELAPDVSAKVSIEEAEITKGVKITTISGKFTSNTNAAVSSLYAELNGKEYPAPVDAEGKFSLAFSNSDIAGLRELTLTPADEEREVRYNAVEISL